MEVFKVTKNADYTVLDNGFLKRGDISLKAIGLLSKILSLPPNWNFSVKGIAVTCKESEKAIRGILKELQLLGYHHYSKISKNGTFVYQYDFYENFNLNPHYQKTDGQNAHVQKVKVLNVDVPKVDIQKGNDNKINKESNTQQIKYSKINIIPDFSEKRTDLSANADSKNNFPNSNFSLNQPVSPPIEEAISKESEKKKPSRSASKGKNPFEIEYTEGFIKFWKAFTPHGSKGQSFDYWKEFKLEAQTERVLKALELYHLELQAQPWREKIHGERFLKNLLAGYFDKLEDPSSLISSAEKDNQIQARRDEIRPKWMYEMADRQKNKEKTIEFNDWLAQNNMPELIKVYTYTD